MFVRQTSIGVSKPKEKITIFFPNIMIFIYSGEWPLKFSEHLGEKSGLLPLLFLAATSGWRGVAGEKNSCFAICQPTRRTYEFSAHLRPSEYLLPTFYHFYFPAGVLLRFPPTHTFPRCLPTKDLQRNHLRLLKKYEKNRRLSEIFRYSSIPMTFRGFRLPTTFSGPP